MIRFLIVALVLVLFLILSIPYFLVAWIVRKFNPKLMDASVYAIVSVFLRLIGFLSGMKLTVIGRENLPSKDEAVLYVGNHRGFYDLVATVPCLPGVTGFLAKKEFRKIPLFSSWMVLLHALFLDRSDIRQGLKVILEGIEMIKGGMSMCVYPEGTRSRDEDQTQLLPFHEGSFKLATKTDCRIVPMAITNTSAVFEDHFPRIKATHVTLEFLPPFRPSELTKEQKKAIGAYTQGLIAEAVRRNLEA